MKAPLATAVLVSFLVCLALRAEPTKTYTWSSTACPACQSTIVYSDWYSDGSPLVAEGMSGTNAGALVALSVKSGVLVLSLGLNISHEPALTLNLRDKVTVESDSATNMVLYAMEPGQIFHKADLVIQRQLNAHSLALAPSIAKSGFLFFPFDAKASHLTVVVRVGDEVFRFPFARDTNPQPRFVDPAKFGAAFWARVEPLHSQGSPAETPARPGTSRISPVSIEGSQTRALAAPTQLATCSRNVSFAVAEDGQMVTRAPDFTEKWIEKNGKKYFGLCFSQMPNPQAANFLIVFAKSQSAFHGIYPSVRHSTSTSDTPVNGQGTVTDNYGGMWNYTYTGTVRTTTTTASYLSLPYTDTTHTMYAYVYDQSGRLLSERRRMITTRQGGDGAGTLGYNLGAALGAIHLKQRLLTDALKDVGR